MNVDIKPLVEKYPNDAELGEKIEKIYWDRIDKINKYMEVGTIYESLMVVKLYRRRKTSQEV